MDLNELFRKHQLALMAVSQTRSAAARSVAARTAEECAVEIHKHRSAEVRRRAVLSAETLLALSSDHK